MYGNLCILSVTDDPHLLLISFSFYTNVKSLFRISRTSTDLQFLNGIRFFSIVWVVLGHSYVSILFAAPINLTDGLKVNKKSFHHHNQTKSVVECGTWAIKLSISCIDTTLTSTSCHLWHKYIVDRPHTVQFYNPKFTNIQLLIPFEKGPLRMITNTWDM